MPLFRSILCGSPCFRPRAAHAHSAPSGPPPHGRFPIPARLVPEQCPHRECSRRHRVCAFMCAMHTPAPRCYCKSRPWRDEGGGVRSGAGQIAEIPEPIVMDPASQLLSKG